MSPDQSSMDEEFLKIVNGLNNTSPVKSWDDAQRSLSLRRGLFWLGSLAGLAGVLLGTVLFAVPVAVVAFCFSVVCTFFAVRSTPAPRTKGGAGVGVAAARGSSGWYQSLEQRWERRSQRWREDGAL